MFFNTKPKQNPRNQTLSGGESSADTRKLELVSMLLSSTLKDECYREADASVRRVKQLVAEVSDMEFVARAAVYARAKAGRRGVSHLVAAEIARNVKGESWTAPFFRKLCRRPDDAPKILACYTGQYGRPIPNSMKKGLGQALADFDANQLARYRRNAEQLSLVDAVNLVHPPHSEPLARLIRGTLASTQTWEAKLAHADTHPSSAKQLGSGKVELMKQLVTTGRIGCFALLRNLHSILAAAPQLSDELVDLLTDERLIMRSSVQPFQYIAALEALERRQPPGALRIMAALSDAVDISLANVPRFGGRTLVALDASGAMKGRPGKMGSLVAAVLAKASHADVMLFNDTARHVSVNACESTLSIARGLESQCVSGRTNFNGIFQAAGRKYDRLVILSHMQGWIDRHAPTAAWEQWKASHACKPRVYSFDLNGCGTLRFPEPDVYCFAGWPDRALEVMRHLDGDRQALISEVEKIELV